MDCNCFEGHLTVTLQHLQGVPFLLETKHKVLKFKTKPIPLTLMLKVTELSKSDYSLKILVAKWHSILSHIGNQLITISDPVPDVGLSAQSPSLLSFKHFKHFTRASLAFFVYTLFCSFVTELIHSSMLSITPHWDHEKH